MAYVGVLSAKPSNPAYRSTFKYFKKYLITMGDPTNAKNWTIYNIRKHMIAILRAEYMPNSELMIDSGGFQFITGKIKQDRIKEYVECYHWVLDEFSDEIQKIFSLDVNHFEFSKEVILKYNTLSTQMTIDLIKKKPELKEKILFVFQNRNIKVFEIWRELFIQMEGWKYFDLYSIGGLVGLKRDTKVDFNHAVPATMWLLTYAKHYNFDVKQLHWLGQSSKVVFIAMAILERTYGIYLTSDSSELVRFAPIAAKLPLVQRKVAGCIKTGFEDTFTLARNPKHVKQMLAVHSWDDDKCVRANRENLEFLGIDRDVLNLVSQDLIDFLISKYWGNEFNYKQQVYISPNYGKIKKEAIEKENREILEYNLAESRRVMDIHKVGIIEIVDDLIDLHAGVYSSKALAHINIKADENMVCQLNDTVHLSTEELSKTNRLLVAQYRVTINNTLAFKYQNQRSKHAVDYFNGHRVKDVKDGDKIIQKEYIEHGAIEKKLDNADQIEVVCQHVENAMQFAEEISKEILEIGLHNCTIENLKPLHEIMGQGKTAKTTYENIQWILRFQQILEDGDVEAADNIMREIVLSYEGN